MNVLISGGTGFIGSSLVHSLREAGHVVSALSRNSGGALQRVPDLERAHDWNPLAGPPPPEAFEEVDAVVNLAGEPVAGLWTARKKRAIRESRVTGTRNLIDGIRRADPRPSVLISASAIGYYGDRGDDRLTEASPPADDFLATLCRDWEEEASAADGLGLRVVRLRIGLVLASGGGPLEPMLLPFRMGLGGRFGSGRQWWPWIHREDLIGLILWSLDNDHVSGPLNACAPEPARQREFARILGRVIGRPAFMVVPGFVLKVILREFSHEILTSRRVVPERPLELGYTFHYRTIDAALRNILPSDQPMKSAPV